MDELTEYLEKQGETYYVVLRPYFREELRLPLSEAQVEVVKEKFERDSQRYAELKEKQEELNNELADLEEEIELEVANLQKYNDLFELEDNEEEDSE